MIPSLLHFILLLLTTKNEINLNSTPYFILHDKIYFQFRYNNEKRMLNEYLTILNVHNILPTIKLYYVEVDGSGGYH